MTMYRALKARGAEFTSGEVTTVFEPVGEIESAFSYSGPSAQAIGEKFGDGEFVLLGETGRFEAVVVEHAPSTFVFAEDEAVAA
jgi:hypothetical protein